jgi:hypothetical protein
MHTIIPFELFYKSYEKYNNESFYDNIKNIKSPLKFVLIEKITIYKDIYISNINKIKK